MRIRDADYAELAEFRYQIRRYLRFSDEAARAAGIEPQQHQLLLALRGMGKAARPTIGDIAERLQVQHQSAVGLVDRAEERGLVSRQRGAGDHRTVRVELTAAGERVLAELSRSHRAELRSAAPALLNALTALLEGEPATTHAEGRE